MNGELYIFEITQQPIPLNPSALFWYPLLVTLFATMFVILYWSYCILLYFYALPSMEGESVGQILKINKYISLHKLHQLQKLALTVWVYLRLGGILCRFVWNGIVTAIKIHHSHKTAIFTECSGPGTKYIIHKGMIFMGFWKAYSLLTFYAWRKYIHVWLCQIKMAMRCCLTNLLANFK